MTGSCQRDEGAHEGERVSGRFASRTGKVRRQKARGSPGSGVEQISGQGDLGRDRWASRHVVSGAGKLPAQGLIDLELQRWFGLFLFIGEVDPSRWFVPKRCGVELTMEAGSPFAAEEDALDRSSWADPAAIRVCEPRICAIFPALDDRFGSFPAEQETESRRSTQFICSAAGNQLIADLANAEPHVR